MKKIKVSDIAKFLNKPFFGEDFDIKGVSSLNNLKKNSVTFCNNYKNLENKIIKKILKICKKKINHINQKSFNFILSDNPKLDLAKILSHFFEIKKNKIEKTSIIHKDANVSKNVSIGHYSIINKNVQIGEGTVIENHVVVDENTIIGKNCLIKSGSIIGETGFGFAFDSKKPIPIYHSGKVVIGDNVLIGSNSIINRGTIENTIIEDNVKIDDHCFIAHNCHIKENAIIIAMTEISGSCIIGKNSWIGPGSSIIQKTNIGENSLIGIGSIVRKDISSNFKVQSLDCLSLKDFIKLKKLIS